LYYSIASGELVEDDKPVEEKERVPITVAVPEFADILGWQARKVMDRFWVS
jgi:hypothetical protein